MMFTDFWSDNFHTLWPILTFKISRPLYISLRPEKANKGKACSQKKQDILKEEIHKKNNNIIRGPLIVLSFTDTQFLISAARDFFPRYICTKSSQEKNEQFIGSFLSNWNWHPFEKAPNIMRLQPFSRLQWNI